MIRYRRRELPLRVGLRQEHLGGSLRLVGAGKGVEKIKQQVVT
jgi:hypothetical protein